MRIAFLSTDFKPGTGGICELAHQLARQFALQGHAVRVVTRDGGDPGEVAFDAEDHTYDVVRPFPMLPYPGVRSLKSAWAISRWRRRATAAALEAVEAFGADLVFAGNYNVALMSSVLPKCREPVYLFLHGGELNVLRQSRWPLHRMRFRRALGACRHVFCNSSFTRGLAESVAGHSIPNSEAVGCGVDLSDVPPPVPQAEARVRLGLDLPGPVLCTVARLVYNKGVDTVIRAVAALRDRYPGLRYLVAGKGPETDALKALVSELGLDRIVTLLGFVDDERKHLLYCASDLYVMTSRLGRSSEIEGFGISFLEANVNGLAVVGSRVGGIPDSVEDGVNGRLVPPDDPPALATAIRELLDAPPRRRQMAAAGRRRIDERFNWPAVASRVLQRVEATCA